MTEYIPNWLHKRYLTLLKKFSTEPFTFMQATQTLNDDSRIVNLSIAGLRNKGWLTTTKNPNNPKKKIHQLKTIKEIYNNMEIKEL